MGEVVLDDIKIAYSEGRLNYDTFKKETFDKYVEEK